MPYMNPLNELNILNFKITIQHVTFDLITVNPFSTGTGFDPVQSLWKIQNLVWNGLRSPRIIINSHCTVPQAM